MRRIVPLPSFERSIKKLTQYEKQELAKGLESFNKFILAGQPITGLGFKKIDYNKYEFRIDIRLRVILKIDSDTFYLVLAGNHDDVKRYLRNIR